MLFTEPDKYLFASISNNNYQIKLKLDGTNL